MKWCLGLKKLCFVANFTVTSTISFLLKPHKNKQSMVTFSETPMSFICSIVDAVLICKQFNLT